MSKEQSVKELFEAIDNSDTEAFLTYLSEDVFFRFGNAEPTCGNEAVGDIVHNFFESIKGLQHEVIALWEQGDTVICHGNVTYTRHDSSKLCVPFANIFTFTGDLIRKYLIFVDISELYKAT